MSGRAVVSAGSITSSSIRGWTGDPSGKTAVAHVHLGAGSNSPRLATLRAARAARAAGFTRIRTAALTHAEGSKLATEGWVVAEHLHLLEHSLEALPPSHPGQRFSSNRGSTSDPTVVKLDHACFPLRWRFDSNGLAAAVKATPHHRFRVAKDPNGTTIAYAICGRSARKGFVQRLAVGPAHQGQGLGRALTLDGLRWLNRWRCASAVVNTYAGNDAALALYRSLGFVEQRPGLMVMSIDL